MYIVGAYIRLYSNQYFNSKKKNMITAVVTLGFLYISSIVLNMMGNIHPIFAAHATYFRLSNTIPIFVASVSIFCFFKNMNVGSIKWINKLAATSFSVYLLHENILLRSWLWEMFLNQKKFQENGILVIHAYFSIIVVYCMGIGAHIIYQWGYEKLLKKIERGLEKIIVNAVYNNFLGKEKK